MFVNYFFLDKRHFVTKGFVYMRGHHDINEMNYDNTDMHVSILQVLKHVAKLVHNLYTWAGNRNCSKLTCLVTTVTFSMMAT